MNRIVRTTAGGCVVLTAAVLLSASPAGATDVTYTFADENTAQGSESFFTLDFGKFGGQTTAFTTDTDIVMKFEFPPTLGTARFLDYFQLVDSLTLPGGLETGNITVLIQESQSAFLDFDPATGTGTFGTNDVYAIFFDGDLSAFGIESPFILPAVSTGTIQFDSDSTGTIDMIWEGDGLLGGDPKTAIPFSYVSVNHTVFSIPEQSDFNGDGSVDRDDIGFFRTCFTGEDVDYDAPVCELADFDLDADVDRDDLTVFRTDLGASR